MLSRVGSGRWAKAGPTAAADHGGVLGLTRTVFIDGADYTLLGFCGGPARLRLLPAASLPSEWRSDTVKFSVERHVSALTMAPLIASVLQHPGPFPGGDRSPRVRSCNRPPARRRAPLAHPPCCVAAPLQSPHGVASHGCGFGLR